MFLFNLLELSYNNNIQLKYKHLSGGVELNSRTTVNSEYDLDLGVSLSDGEKSHHGIAVPDLVKAVAKEFPYTEFENPDGPCSHADFIRVMGGDQSIIRYDVIEYVYRDKVNVVRSSRRKPIIVDCLEDLSAHPEKVQRFASLVFTEEVKSEFIAALPRVYMKQASVSRPVQIDNPNYDPANIESLPKINKTEIVDKPYDAYVDRGGVLRPAGTRPERVVVVEQIKVKNPDESKVMAECSEEEAEETFIAYKNEIYPDGWNGDLGE